MLEEPSFKKKDKFQSQYYLELQLVRYVPTLNYKF
jgi:hypothetical protein